MKRPWIFALGAFCVASAAAHAEAPVAVVEDVSSKSGGVEFMDYVVAGKVIELAPQDSLVLGYIQSCWRETIHGGTVTVGSEQSEVKGGKVDRVKVASDGGKMQLASEQSKQSAAMVFRGAPAPKPQFKIYGRSPVVELRGGGTLVIDRVDVPGEKIELTIAASQLVHGAFYDLAKANKSLKAGGTYRARVGAQQIVFEVAADAKEGETPIASRLLRFQPTI